MGLLWLGADVFQFLVGLGWGVGEGEFFRFDDLFQKRATVFESYVGVDGIGGVGFGVFEGG